MNRYAIIKNGVVVNAVEYASDPGNPPPGFSSGHIAVKDDSSSPGWVYSNGQFTDPNPFKPIMEFSYKEKRAAAYPPIGELADALYWASTGDTSKLDAYYVACAAVKAKYPKT